MPGAWCRTRTQVGSGPSGGRTEVAGTATPGTRRGRGPARLRRGDRAPPHAGIRLYERDPAVHAPQPGARPARSARLHGQRRGAGRALGPAAHALRLLQAALRAGDQPRHRFDPRGSGHVARVLHRSRGQSARGLGGTRAPAAATPPDPLQRAVRRALGAGRPRLETPDARRHLPSGLGEEGPACGALPPGAGCRPRGQRRNPPARALRPRGRPRIAWPSAPCSPSAACITTWCARTSAPASP